MPDIPNRRKIKRATVLTKKTKCLRKFLLKRSYKSLYEKLKSNNHSLARALSKEKQECQLLFSQKVALIADIQDLNLACNKRDSVISNVLKNAKEMLAMLVTMTGYITNTISSCQEFVNSNNINASASRNSAGKRESCRLSTKSPAKGVVRPMVSGHTITKPTINLSRVNINVQSRLSSIQESPNASPNQEINEIRSPTIPINREISETTRTCRLPERLTLISPRASNEGDERSFSRRSSRYSGRLSGRRSRPKSGKLSGEHVTRRSIENIEHIGSPRVKLNDVSKFLQNSHSVNVKMLTENVSNSMNESSKSEQIIMHNRSTRESDTSLHNDTTTSLFESHTSSGEDKTMASTEMSMCSSPNHSPNCKSTQQARHDSKKHNTSADWEDPLEGPSWLHNEDQSPNSRYGEISNTSICDGNNDPSFSMTLENGKSTNRDLQHNSSLPKKDVPSSDEESYDLNLPDEEEEDFPLSVRNTGDGSEERDCQEDAKSNINSYITHRREPSIEVDDDLDDFTLMFKRKQRRSFQFDINNLRLPDLESPIVPPTVNDPEPEITSTIQRITINCPLPSLSNNNMNNSLFEQPTIKLSLLNDDDRSINLTPTNNKKSSIYKKKSKRNQENTTVTEENDLEHEDKVQKTKNKRKRKLKKSDRDPSTAKVVLQKLNTSYVKPRSPPSEEHSRDSNYSSGICPSPNADNMSDTDSSNASTNKDSVAGRPRRRKAPINLKEPSLHKKLRRNF